MKLIKTKIKDCYEIKLNKFNDERGYFTRAFCKKIFKDNSIKNNIFQINFSYSKKRGLLEDYIYKKNLLKK